MGMSAAIADLRLFARKGEAMPADVKRSRFRPEAGADRRRAAVGDGYPASDDTDPASDLTALSGLIQRRVLTDVVAPPADPPSPMKATREAAADGDAYPRAGTPRAKIDEPNRPRLRPTLSLFVCDETPDDATWRKMTVRLPETNYQEIRSLAHLWGTSYQTLLRQAVARFLENAVNAHDGHRRRH